MTRLGTKGIATRNENATSGSWQQAKMLRPKLGRGAGQGARPSCRQQAAKANRPRPWSMHGLEQDGAGNPKVTLRTQWCGRWILGGRRASRRLVCSTAGDCHGLRRRAWYWIGERLERRPVAWNQAWVVEKLQAYAGNAVPGGIVLQCARSGCAGAETGEKWL